MQRSVPYIAWTLIALAILAWAAVGYGAWTISSESAARAGTLRDADDEATRHAADVRTQGIAKDSEADRARLTGLLNVDILHIVDTLESIGTASGVKLQLSDAIPENAAKTGASSGNLRAVGFVLQADGSFPALMHIVELFEALPVPATVQRLDISHAASTGAPSDSWHLSTYLRILTTADVSS